MDQLGYRLFTAQRELEFAKRHLEQAIALPHVDMKRGDYVATLPPRADGRPIFLDYPSLTFRERAQKEVDVCQSRVDDAALAVRRDRVLTRWAWRQIHRQEKAAAAEARKLRAARRSESDWMQPMSPDDVYGEFRYRRMDDQNSFSAR